MLNADFRFLKQVALRERDMAGSPQGFWGKWRKSGRGPGTAQEKIMNGPFCRLAPSTDSRGLALPVFTSDFLG